MIECITIQERENCLKQVKKILNEFEVTLKTAENLYAYAVRDGNKHIQKEIQKKIDNIKKEIDYLKKIMIGLENI